jgi:CRISPR/Cas system CSM-associated protein Csm3 (group 7 of RAMP superfamily)
MSTFIHQFEIEFAGYWHAGTGETGPGDLDSVVLRDASKIPYFPGKALKGLFHEAFCGLTARAESNPAEFESPSREDLMGLFGAPGSQSIRLQSRLRFSNANLPRAEHAAIVAAGCQSGLTQAIASTALEEGIAVNRTLRRIEVAIPMTLRFEIAFRGNDPGAPGAETVSGWLDQAAASIEMAGAQRHNGLGECRVRRVPAPTLPVRNPNSGIVTPMVEEGDLLRISFAAVALEPVILGGTPATTGSHESLDFLTGAALLGAFARDRYEAIEKLGDQVAFGVFHSGAVRFGDAHPISASGHAAQPVPASWHFEKGAKLFEGPQHQPKKLDAAKLIDLAHIRHTESTPPKQVRGQWLSGDGTQLNVGKRNHLKSARDSSSFGRPAESQLFAYQSIEEGQRFAGEIHIRRDRIHPAAIECLLTWIKSSPVIWIGRSKTAEFGSCRLELLHKPLPLPPSRHPEKGILLYALSDLCPLGVELIPSDGKEWHECLAGWTINPERTHVRVRGFSRWNGHRGCPDPAARVLSRGSVIAFDPPGGIGFDADLIQRHLNRDGIGLHLQHGLGRILVNPDFASLSSSPIPALELSANLSEKDLVETPLVSLAKRRHSQVFFESQADALAGGFQQKWNRFIPAPAPSQWSRLRHLAGSSRDFAEFVARAAKVFDHGAARRVWERARQGSGSLLDEFIVNLPPLEKRANEGPAVSGKLPEVSPLLRKHADRGERLVLLAVAEACRRLRQHKRS